jgi:hypothetical protein
MRTEWIPRSRLQGLTAEYSIAGFLTSEGCLVRPVPEPTETGIALHCEMAAKGRGQDSPLVHFWVQTRFGDEVQVLEHGAQVSCLFRTEDLVYWKRQPIPVVAIFVSGHENPAHPTRMYFVHLSNHLRATPLPEDKERVCIRSEGILDPNSLDHLRRFFSLISETPPTVPHEEETAPDVSSTLAEAYVRQPVAAEGDRHWWEVCEELRHTTAMALPELIIARPQCKDPEAQEFLRLLRMKVVPVVRLYAEVGDQHWETHYALGVDAMETGDPRRAAIHFERAESHVTLDEDFKRDYPQWPQVIEDIRRRKKTCLAAVGEAE